jgi:hypothetical protein
MMVKQLPEVEHNLRTAIKDMYDTLYVTSQNDEGAKEKMEALDIARDILVGGYVI